VLHEAREPAIGDAAVHASLSTLQLKGPRTPKKGGSSPSKFLAEDPSKMEESFKNTGCYHQTIPTIWFNHLFLGFYHQKNRGRTIESWNLTTKPLKISGCDTQKQGISQQVVKSPVLNGTGWWFQPIHFQCARHPKYRSFLI